TQLFDYARLKQEEVDLPFALEKAAYIFHLQAKYSLLELRQEKLKKQHDAVHSLQKKGIELVRKCLKHIDISQDDIAARKEKMEKSALEQKKLLLSVQKEMNALDNNLLRYEVQLETVEKKIASEKKKHKGKKPFLKVEAKRIAAFSDTVAIKRCALEQKKIKQKTNALKAAFLYYQIRHYAGQKDGEDGDNIQYWIEKQEDLNGIYTAIKEEVLLLSRQKNQIQQKLLLTTDESEVAEDRKTKKSLALFKQHLVEQQDLLDSNISSLLENQENIKSLTEEIDWYLELLRQEMPWYENFSVYFEKNFRKSWETSLSIIHSPLLSFSKIEISIAFILKFIFLLILGLLVLRLVRGKIMSVLRKKTRLSYGSVTSLTTLGYYLAVVFVFFIILNMMGVDLTQLTVIFGALGIGIGFGLQTIMNNFISGIILLAEQVIRTGDIVHLESGVTGEVKKVAIRSTIIRTVDGDDIIVPNSEFVAGRVNTWTYKDNWRRITVPFGVSYDSDPAEVVRLAEET
ncbi:MAG: hypothetical protein D3923_14695, partial [Candidatus Electrothrix sp. AR3]|nr:hypothetical protein [Candidatus Electrothrix sp. AR3]